MRDLADYQEKYNQPGFEDIQVRYRRKKILEEMEKASARRIVEIGCGMEPLFLHCSGFDRYVFFEPGDVFFRNADRLAKEAAPDRITGYPLPFSFREEVRAMKPDFIVCASLLHEVEDPQALLRDIRETAGADTVIHLNVPNAFSLHRRLARAMGLMKDEREFSERNRALMQHQVFDAESLLALVDQCGLRVTDRGGMLLKPFAHAQMWDLTQSGLLTDRMLDGLYQLGNEMPELASEIWINCRRKGV